MKDKKVLSKALAISGTVLVWIPVLFPIIFSISRLLSSRRFMLDYLMPAELSPAALIGGLLLIGAAFQSHKFLKLLVWSLVSALVLLVGSQVLAALSGLASGRIEPPNIWWTLVIILLVLFVVVVIVLGISGILLIRHLFRKIE